MRARFEDIVVLGRVGRRAVGLWLSDVHHGAVFGATGCGKSTLITTMVLSLAARGYSVVVIDPHSDLIRSILQHVPRHLEDRVIVVDPRTGPQYGRVVVFDWFAVSREDQLHTFSVSMAEAIEHLVGDMGQQMRNILATSVTALAFARYYAGQRFALADVHRFAVDGGFRRDVMNAVEEGVRRYCEEKLVKLLGERARSLVEQRLGTFRTMIRKAFASATRQSAERLAQRLSELSSDVSILSPMALFLNLVGQRSLHEILNSGEQFIVLIDASINIRFITNLFATLFFYAGRMRSVIPRERRHPTYLFVDEAHNITVSEVVKNMYGELRKFRMFVTIATQSPEKLPREALEGVRQSSFIVFFNPGQNDYRAIDPQINEIAKSLPKHRFVMKTVVRGRYVTVRAAIETIPPWEYPVQRSDEEVEQLIRRSVERWGVPIA